MYILFEDTQDTLSKLIIRLYYRNEAVGLNESQKFCYIGHVLIPQQSNLYVYENVTIKSSNAYMLNNILLISYFFLKQDLILASLELLRSSDFPALFSQMLRVKVLITPQITHF